MKIPNISNRKLHSRRYAEASRPNANAFASSAPSNKTDNKTAKHWRATIADFLTRRHGTWQFVRRVPPEFAAFDSRGIIRHSTKIGIFEVRKGRRASSVSEKLNGELKAFWRAKVGNSFGNEVSRYELACQQVRSQGFDLLEMPRLIALPPEQTIARLEALASKAFTRIPTHAQRFLGGSSHWFFCCRSCNRSTSPL